MEKIWKDGIELCEDTCPCGAKMRLHINTFGKQKGNPHQKFYVDCEDHCGRVSDWMLSPDAAIAAFDSEYGTRRVVSNAK